MTTTDDAVSDEKTLWVTPVLTDLSVTTGTAAGPYITAGIPENATYAPS